MFLTILISVFLSVIITLGIVYYGIVQYNKRLEKQAQEASKELTKMLKTISQQETDLMNNFHSADKGGMLQ